MNPVLLLKTLVEEMKELLKEKYFINSKGELVALNIFTQHLPYRKKENNTPPFPYLIVSLEEGEIPDFDNHYIQIYFIIGIQDKDENTQGDLDVMNVITQIYQHLFGRRIIADMYEIIHPFKWAIQDENTFPKFIGGIETNWKIRTIQEEEDNI